jgi:hypothetical protein
MEILISQATRRNWDRLHVSGSKSKLTSRANKTHSNKTILPIEYFSDIKNLSMIEEILDEIRAWEYKLFDIMYSIILNCFDAFGITDAVGLAKTNVRNFLSQYSGHTAIRQRKRLTLPLNESDLLGLIYQSLCAEGEKNKQGLYYTPAHVAGQLNAKLDFSKGQCLLDPCCGSGSFLMNTPVLHPAQLYGVDCDPVAVMLCKANFIMRYKELDFEPQVYCFDFLTESGLFDSADTAVVRGKKFDYVSTNPPWGAVSKNSFSKLNKGDSFTHFLITSLGMLKENGNLNFLLPEAFLNVKTHSQLRTDIAKNYSVKKIQLLPNLFTGVTTKVVALTVANRKEDGCTTVIDGQKTYTVNALSSEKSINCVFSLITPKDKEILASLYAKGCFDLSKSTWALGIVTGNNAEKLSDSPLEKGEPIYTGKEIRAFRLLPPKKYIIYDRSRFQQAAKDEIYRAKEKLVYKFISNKLVFAYDDKGSLFLNSANILIPDIPTISMQSILVFLNSELFQFAYIKQFGEIKILKGNLCALPFPKLLPSEDTELKILAKNIISGNEDAAEKAQSIIYNYYGISEQQIQHIREGLKNGVFA